MMHKIAIKSHRIWILLLLVALLAALPVSTVSAALRSCRTDPIVFLSNGQIVAVSATVGTDPANVALVSYTLHVPQGAQVKRVVYTGGALLNKEALSVVDDQAKGHYYVETIVSTLVGTVEVSTTFNLFSFGRITAWGSSGEPLRMELRSFGPR
jgi:hypothetical protein